MNQNFKTTSISVVVESKTHAGSGFAVTDTGAAVFMSRRLIETMQLEEGDMVTAFCIPNYEDKRDVIPWRAIRVERNPVDIEASRLVAPHEEGGLLDRIMELPDIQLPVDRKAADIDQMVKDRLLETEGHWTTRELADDLGLDFKAVSNSCIRLFNKSRIAKADVFSGPDQSRASFTLWGSTTDDFK